MLARDSHENHWMRLKIKFRAYTNSVLCLPRDNTNITIYFVKLYYCIVWCCPMVGRICHTFRGRPSWWWMAKFPLSVTNKQINHYTLVELRTESGLNKIAFDFRYNLTLLYYLYADMQIKSNYTSTPYVSIANVTIFGVAFLVDSHLYNTIMVSCRHYNVYVCVCMCLLTLIPLAKF